MTQSTSRRLPLCIPASIVACVEAETNVTFVHDCCKQAISLLEGLLVKLRCSANNEAAAFQSKLASVSAKLAEL